MPKPKLDHCPFCGSEAKLIKDKRNRWIISCGNNRTCQIHPTTRIKTKQEVVAAWNKRVEEKP